MDIVYSLCGTNRKEELLRSLTSLAVLISAAEAADSSTAFMYNVHLITDSRIGSGDMPALLLATACFYLHEPNSRAAPLFAPCSTQRLYLHEHVEFDNVEQVKIANMSRNAQPLCCWLGKFDHLEAGQVQILPASAVTTKLLRRPSTWTWTHCGWTVQKS